LVRLAGAFALALLTAACAGMDPGYSVVSQDRFDFMECPQLLSERGNWTAREKQLSELAAKAEASPGGIIVSAAAYRTELAAARTNLRLVQQAAQRKGCDAKKP
jgi:pectin methylesterase-like acyl-CoA thioesterase